MAKLTLSDITSGYAAPSKYNGNNTLIEQAIENTLSRDGTEPNQMEAVLDMNSNLIINLAAPINDNDAARLADIQNALLGLSAANLITVSDAGNYFTGGNVEAALQELGTTRALLDPLYSKTSAETAAGIADGNINFGIPNHTCGFIYPQRYKALFDASSNGQSGTDDTAAHQRTASVINQLGGGTLVFPAGKYSRVFSSTTGTLYGLTNLIGFKALTLGSKLVVPTNKSITTSEGYLFFLSGCIGVDIDGLSCDGPALDVSQTAVKGYELVHVEGGTRGVHIGVINAKNCLAGFIAQNQTGDLTETSTARCRDIVIGSLYAENCWYGANLQNSGDDFTVHTLRTNTVHRSFFIYGVKKIRADIWSKDHKSVDVLLNSGGAATGYKNRDWKISYHSGQDSNACSTSAAKVQLLFVAGPSNEAQHISDVNIHLDVEYPTSGSNNGGPAFDIHKTTNNGTSDASDRGHILQRLTVSGRIKNQGSNGGGGSGTMQSNANATWGTGDFFSGIVFRDLVIDPVNDSGIPGFIFGNVTDTITLSGVNCTRCFGLANGNSDAQRPRAARVEIIGSSASNMFVNVTDTNGNVRTPLTKADAPTNASTAYAGYCNGVILTNQNTGATTWTLPAAVGGMYIRAVQNGGGRLRLDPNGSEVVQGGGAGVNYYTDSTNGYTELECVNDGTWVIKTQIGTWAYGG